MLITQDTASKASFDISNIVLPSCFSRRVQGAIDGNTLNEPDNRCAFVRECVQHFDSILPRPSENEYKAISKKIVDTYPSLKDARRSDYWVREFDRNA